MGKLRKHQQLKFTPQELIDAFYHHGGAIKGVAKELEVTVQTIYKYIDIFPEVAEAQILADEQRDRIVVETCYDKLDEIVENPDDQAIALKALTVALSKSKKSRYYTPPVNAVAPGSTTNLTEIAELSQELAATRKELERYKAQLIE